MNEKWNYEIEHASKKKENWIKIIKNSKSLNMSYIIK